MYKYVRRIIPQTLLVIYAIISVGSLEETFISIAYVIGAVALVGLLFYMIKVGLEYRRDRNKALAALSDAEKKFGAYTSKIESEMGEYILYDQQSHRILLKDTIVDSRKITRMATTRKGEKSAYSYEEYEENSSGALKRRNAQGIPTGQGQVVIRNVDTTGCYTIEVFDDEDILRARFLTEEYPYHRKTKHFLQEIIDNNKSEQNSAQRVGKAKYSVLMPLVAGNVIAGGRLEDYSGLLEGGFVLSEEGGRTYELGQDAVDVINGSWSATFSKAKVFADDTLIRKFTGLSKAYPAIAFSHLKEDATRLSAYITGKYGQPETTSGNISYTSVTEDSSRITAYLWKRPGHLIKIDIVFDQGRFKYEFTSEI